MQFKALCLSGTFTGYFNAVYLTLLLLERFKQTTCGVCDSHIGMVNIRDYSIIMLESTRIPIKP